MVGRTAGLLALAAGGVALAVAGLRPDAPAPGPDQPVVTASCVEGRWAVAGECVDAKTALAPTGTLYTVAGNDPRASDANAGTADAPWKTIGRAAQAMRPGDGVVIRAGVYRESIQPVRGGTSASARITYAAWPGETVVVTGAEPAPTGWTALGQNRWRRAWTFGALPTYSDDPVFRRELAAARGHVLRPVATLGALVPGTMHVAGSDTAPTTLTVWLPDTVRPDEIEVATRERLFWPVASRPDAPCGDPSQPAWIRVVGLTFQHAANRAQWGAVCAGSAHGLWENATVAWTVGMGVNGSGRSHVFRRVAANDNGQMGWGAQCTDCLFEDTEAVGNNWRGFDPFWEAGGGKWVATHKTTIRRHYAAGNGGPGIWLDGGNTGNTIEGCRVVDNEVAGIMLELDTVETLVQDNVVTGTRWREWSGAGILSQAASRNVILRNTLTGNAGTGLWLRLDPLRRAPDVGTRVEANWIVGNAVGAGTAGGADEAREVAVEAASAALVRSHAFRGNVYGQPGGDPTLVSTFFLAPLRSGADYRGSDLATWRRLTGESGARLAGDLTPPVRPGAPADTRGASVASPGRTAGGGVRPARVAETE